MTSLDVGLSGKETLLIVSIKIMSSLFAPIKACFVQHI